MCDGKWTILPEDRGEQIFESNERSNGGSVSSNRNININSSNDEPSSDENRAAVNGERFNGSNWVQRDRNSRVQCDESTGRYGDGEVTESDHDGDDKGDRR
jgi:hypothetical protein